MSYLVMTLVSRSLKDTVTGSLDIKLNYTQRHLVNRNFFETQIIPTICFLVSDDTFSQLEFPMTSSANRCLSEETGGVSVSFLVGEDDSDDDDQTIPMQIASGSAAAVSCDVTDYSSRDLCSAMSHDLTSSDCESRGTLVAPEAERMESIKVRRFSRPQFGRKR